MEADLAGCSVDAAAMAYMNNTMKRLNHGDGEGGPRGQQTIGQYGKIGGAAPGQCSDPQAWAFWSENTQWEAGVEAQGRKKWQNPTTPTVRPPWGTMPRPQSLRGVPSPGRAPGTGMSYTPSAPPSALRTPRSSRFDSAAAPPPAESALLEHQLAEARAEIARLAELKAARSEIEALRAHLTAEGALQPAPPPELAAPPVPTPVPTPLAAEPVPQASYVPKPFAPPGRKATIQNGSPRSVPRRFRNQEPPT